MTLAANMQAPLRDRLPPRRRSTAAARFDEPGLASNSCASMLTGEHVNRLARVPSAAPPPALAMPACRRCFARGREIHHPGGYVYTVLG